MSTLPALNPATMDQVGELFGRLGALTKNYQIYGPEHRRTQEGMADYLRHAGKLMQLPGIEGQLVVAYHDGRFFLEHVPIMVDRKNGFLFVAHLEANRLSGFRLALDLSEDQLEGILAHLAVPPSARKDWVNENVPGFRWLVPEEVNRLESSSPREVFNLHLLLQLPELRVEEEVYFRTMDTLSIFMLECADSDSDNFETAHRASNELVDQFIHDSDAVMPLTTIPYCDRFIYHHSLNVALLTLKAASLLTSSQEQLRRIGQAALLHDIGKSDIPAEILYKPSRLTVAEAEIVMRHPVIGAERLARFPNADPLAAAVAFGHHIKNGGQGYPKVSPGYQLGPATALVAVADMFEALTAQRPYKGAMTAADAFGVLYSMPNMKSFRPYVDLLVRAVGFQPQGTRVKGPNGETGVVVGHDNADPRCPIVRTFEVEAGGRYRLESPEVKRGVLHSTQKLLEDGVAALDPDEDLCRHS